MFLQGCGIYSFSGTSLPPKAKTISLDFQSKVALGPPDLVEKFQQQLGDELVQRTPLKRVYTKGDLQLEGDIRQFKYTSMAPTKKEDRNEVSIDRLTIEVQMSYINLYNEKASFSKKIFSKYADTSAYKSRTDEEPRLIEEIITKLVKDIFNETVASW
jgi:hypothetical protein